MTVDRRNQGVRDRSAGWEAVAGQVIDQRRSAIGAAAVEAWAAALPAGGRVLDLGCGAGSPRSEALARRGFQVCAVDAAPSLARAYQARFPETVVICEAAEDCALFGQAFDGILAWGLLFLLKPVVQRALLARTAAALKAGGELLFTAPTQRCAWKDLSTGRTSVSLGRQTYREIVEEAGLVPVSEFDDEGQNHYYRARKLAGSAVPWP